MIYIVLIVGIILGIYSILKDKFKNDGSFIDIMNKSIHLRTIIMTITFIIILILSLFFRLNLFRQFLLEYLL